MSGQGQNEKDFRIDTLCLLLFGLHLSVSLQPFLLLMQRGENLNKLLTTK